MKKYTTILMSAALLASSCTTGAGSGAYAGSTLGSILGSAIGGIAGGPRGSDIGTIVGMAGGAIVGGALGDAAEKQQYAAQSDELARRNQRIQRSKARRQQSEYPFRQGQYSPQQDYTYSQPSARQNYGQGSSQAYSQPDTDIDPSAMVDSTNLGDDRIDFSPSDGTGAQNGVHVGAQASAGQTAAGAGGVPTVDASRIESIYSARESRPGHLTIKNVRFADTDGDSRLHSGEIGRVSFEIYNNTDATVYDFYPTVAAAESARISISPSVRVESIAPGQGIRYTATVRADRRVKTGTQQLMVSATKAGKPISYVTVLKVDTER